jgi:hypothetical protein
MKNSAWTRSRGIVTTFVIAFTTVALVAMAALILSILGISDNNNNNGTPAPTPPGGGPNGNLLLYMQSNLSHPLRSGVQPQLLQQSLVRYNVPLLETGIGWQRVSETEFRCLQTARYEIYFTLQVVTNGSIAVAANAVKEAAVAAADTDPLLPVCQRCHLEYAAHVLLTRNGQQQEIPSSLTHARGDQLYLSKRLYVGARVGDLVSLEVVTPCSQLQLNPLPSFLSLQSPDLYRATSATLAISN